SSQRQHRRSSRPHVSSPIHEPDGIYLSMQQHELAKVKLPDDHVAARYVKQQIGVNTSAGSDSDEKPVIPHSMYTLEELRKRMEDTLLYPQIQNRHYQNPRSDRAFSYVDLRMPQPAKRRSTSTPTSPLGIPASAASARSSGH